MAVIDDIAEGEDISGIACVKTGGQVRRCVIAVDEKVSAIFVTIDGKTIKQDGELKLIEKVKGQELDAEGVAYDSKGNAFYVIGSHGRKRTCCKDNPSSFNLIRVPIDPSTGRLDPDDGSGMAPAAWIAPRNILPAMQRSPQLAKRANACLGTKPPQKKGKVGGLRLPTGAGRQYRGHRDPRRHRVPGLSRARRRRHRLPAGVRPQQPVRAAAPQRCDDPDQARARQGVRDLAAVADGLLVLSGPEDDEPGQAAIHHFDPKTQAITLLGTLAGLPKKAKPEALLVLSEDAPDYQVLVLSDGVPNGSPLEYKVPKP